MNIEKQKANLFLSKLPGYSGFSRIKQILRNIKGNDAVIQGNIHTTNIGDLSICLSIGKFLEERSINIDYDGYITKKIFNIDLPYIPDYSSYNFHIVAGGAVIRDDPDYLSCRLKPISDSSKSMLVGVGCYNEIKNSRAIKMLKNIDESEFITVRDKESKKHIQKHIDKEVILTACPAFLLEDFFQYHNDSYLPIFNNRDKKNVGINLRPNSHKDYPEFISNLKRYIIKNKDEYDFFFIPFSFTDFRVLKNFDLSKYMKIFDVMPPFVILKIIENMDKIIFNRYHALIFSILKNKPFLCYDPYGKEKYQSKVGQILKEFEPIDYLPYNYNNQNLEELFCEDIKKIKSIRIEKKKLAKKNFSFIEKILNS